MPQVSAERTSARQALVAYQWVQVLSEALAGLVCGGLVLWSFQSVIACQACVATRHLRLAGLLRAPRRTKLNPHHHRENSRWMATCLCG